MTNIISEFEAFMGKNGQYYSQFYVGITDDPRERLVSGHGVHDRIPHIYTTNPLPTTTVRNMEKYFLQKGARGGTGGGIGATRYLYSYLITNSTRQ